MVLSHQFYAIQLKMKTNKIRNVWYDFDTHIASKNTSHDPQEINKQLAAIFCPGPFYYYIFDFGTYSFAFMSEHYKTIIGLDPTTLTIDQFLGRAHPDDIDYFSRSEKVIAKFLFEYLEPKQILNYKVSYCFRLLTANNTYKLFLHQAMGITLDEWGNLGRVLGVHSDISHITTSNNRKLSLFGLNGEPSFTNIDVYKKDAVDFKPDTINLTPRETEILRLLAEGVITKEIAKTLFIAEPTVRKHRENLLRKTNSKNTAHLIANSIKNGLI